MKVSTRKHMQPDHFFHAAEASNAIRIETAQGVFSIIENKDGSLGISESTHRHLTLQPVAANAVQLGTHDPTEFNQR